MKNLIVRIRGGLGNQLFIIGFALYVKSVFKDAKIYCDVREYKKYKIRSYELSSLKIDNVLSEYTPKYNITSIKYDLLIKILHLRLYLIKKLKLSYTEKNEWEERLGIIYNTAEINPNKFRNNDIFLYGYFVNVRPLLEIRTELRLLIEIKEKSEILKCYLQEIAECNHSVAISMRFGQDYVANKWPICSRKYYQKALSMLERENTQIFVFTDELDAAKDYFKGKKNVTFIEKCSPSEQMSIMKECDDFIISNSTFAWWGAFLGKKENRVICSPKIWHLEETTSTNLYFDNMKIISEN